MSKVVVVTGATAGIGRAIVQEFARKKYSIGVLARASDRLEETVKEVEQLGGQALAVATDVAKPQQVAHAADQVEEAFGPIDIWVNNAMVTVFSPVSKLAAEEITQVTDVTYHGTVNGTLTALQRMKTRNSGKIVQVGSALSYRAIPLQSAYCGAKHAIRGFTDALRVELQHEQSDVQVTMVQLPGHNTPQFSWSRNHLDKHPQPVPPIFQPEVAARAVLFATEEDRREVWVGRSAVATIFLSQLFPHLVDWYLSKKGYSSQFLPNKKPVTKAGNVFHSVEGEYGAHGIFDERAEETSMQLQFEQIPVLHFVTNYVFAGIGIGEMIISFLQSLTKKDSSN